MRVANERSKQRMKVLAAIRQNPEATIRELQAATKFSSTSVVTHHLNRLMLAGIVTKVSRYEINPDADMVGDDP